MRLRLGSTHVTIMRVPLTTHLLTASVDPTVASRNVQGRSAEFRGGSTAPVWHCLTKATYIACGCER